MKKKLIFITEALWIGGIEAALVNLLNQLDYTRYDVTCLILRDCQDLASRITAPCRLIVSDRQHPVSFSTAYPHSRMYNLMEEPQNPTKLRRLIWRMLRLCLRAPEARRYAAYVKEQLGDVRFNTAIIYSDRVAEIAVRAVPADRFLMFYHHGAMRREYHDEYGYRRAERIIAVSEALAEKLRAFRPRYGEKIIAIHNLIDIAGVREKSLETPSICFPKDCFNLVSCGRLSPAKGMDLAVHACARLVQRGHTRIHWWIVGGGPEERALRELIREKGLEDYVTLLGMQSNPYPYIRQADLYVQPSRFEAFGLTILEAMVLGKPVLSTETDGGREIIHSGLTGKLCPPDSASIAAAIQGLYAAPEELSRYRAALEQENFDLANEEIMGKLYALL